MRDLEAPAPQVEEDPVVDRKAVDRAQKSEGGLALAVHDHQLDPESLASQTDQLLSVHGLANRGGCHGQDARRPGSERYGAEIVQGIESPLHRHRPQATLLVYLACQTQGYPCVGQDVQVPGRVQAHDRHASGVRPDVDDSQRGRRGSRSSRSRCRSAPGACSRVHCRPFLVVGPVRVDGDLLRAPRHRYSRLGTREHC